MKKVKIIRALSFALCALMLGTVLRFFFDVYSIQSGSMEDTLLPYDRVFVCKYGVNIKKGDITVFSYTNFGETIYIKRCVGMPGETFEIRQGTIYCDDQEADNQGQIKKMYQIWINDSGSFQAMADSLNIRIPESACNNKDYSIKLALTHRNYSIIRGAGCTDSISYLMQDTDPSGIYVYPHNSLFHWTIHDFGPIMIPYKGMKITLTPYNYALYKKIINRCEKQNIEFKNGHILKDNKIITSYVFKQNYYFFMGDNRQISYDSRSLGFIPEEDIIGKAISVLYNSCAFRFNPKRFLKRVK